MRAHPPAEEHHGCQRIFTAQKRERRDLTRRAARLPLFMTPISAFNHERVPFQMLRSRNRISRERKH